MRKFAKFLPISSRFPRALVDFPLTSSGVLLCQESGQSGGFSHLLRQREALSYLRHHSLPFRFIAFLVCLLSWAFLTSLFRGFLWLELKRKPCFLSGSMLPFSPLPNRAPYLRCSFHKLKCEMKRLHLVDFS